MYAESPAGPREGRQLAVVHPPIRSRRVNPSPAIQEAPLGARNPGWGQGGTGLGGLGEATSFTDRRWYFQWLCPGDPLQIEVKGHLNANIIA